MAGTAYGWHPPALRWPTDEAFRWLCASRRHFPDSADVWPLRFRWQAERKRLLRQLRSGSYRFEPVRRSATADGKVIHLWSARDALVLKALSLLLARPLGVSGHCTHVRHHGGLKPTVADVARHLPHYRYVLRTDVLEYYASIDHEVLLDRLDRCVADRFLMNLLVQYLRRTVDHGGVYVDIRRGIARGCALSPLIGGFYLQALDERLGNSGLYYVRYMDDILLLAPTRCKVRRALRIVHGVLGDLRLRIHPDKTYIGRIEKGFDFRGYRYSSGPLRLAAKTVRQFASRLHRLYDQQQAAPGGAAVLGAYVNRWLRWTRAGLWELDLRVLPCAPSGNADPC